MGGCNWVLQTPPANLYVLVHKSGCSTKLPIIGSYLLNGLGTISTIQLPLNDLFDLVPPVNSKQQGLTSAIAHRISGNCVCLT